VSLSDALCRSYLDLRWHFDPAAATTAGAAGQDDRLGRFDDASVREHLAAFRAIEAGVEELAVEDAADELDRTALLDDIRVTIFRLQHESPHRKNPAFWLLHLCEALHGILARAGEPAEARAGSALARLRATPEFLRTAAATLAEPPEVLVDAARALVDLTADLITRVIDAVGAGLDGRRAELALAGAEAEAALARFRLALDTDLSRHADEHAPAVGEDQFERLLHHMHAVRAGAPELWRYVLHLEEETEQVLNELGAPGSWRDVIGGRIAAAMQADAIPAARAELERIQDFLATADLLPMERSLPTVETLPAHLLPFTGHAVYQAGSVEAPTRDAQLWIAPWASTAAWISQVVAEAGVPGLHLQGARAARPGPEIRRHLSSRLLRGGWGLYAVELLEEAGYWPTAAERILVRSHLLLRALLGRIDIGLHTRRMSPDEAAALLVERLPLEPTHAQAMVYGCCLEPTQAIGALIGRRELIRLREDRRQAGGEEFSSVRHHDEVLGYGSLPVPLIRWGMGLDE